MKRSFYLDLAAQGLRMPIGTDLVLHEQSDPESIMQDGLRLGRVVADAARRYRTPLAIPVMDLRVEKHAMLTLLGVPEDQIDTWHFASAPDEATMTRVLSADHAAPTARQRANNQSIQYVATQKDLVAVGMVIGPFSLVTKLMGDAITPVYLAGTGLEAGDDPDVDLLLKALRLSQAVIERSIRQQVQAGAKAVVICEPAANKLFISPHQITGDGDIFDRIVMGPNLQLRQLLRELDVDLIFHDCGELTDDIVRRFNRLDPAMLSLGSSRQLWHDADLVKPDTVLYGNLPTKKFFSDTEVTLEQVRQMVCELVTQMKRKNRAFVLGSECDVLSVTGCHETIKAKVDALVNHRC
jgi:uroporphyrinogen-III decarboxylase